MFIMSDCKRIVLNIDANVTRKLYKYFLQTFNRYRVVIFD